MRITNKFTELAEEAGQRYVELLTLFRGHANAAIADWKPLSARRRNAIIDLCYRSSRVWFEAERMHIDDGLRAALVNARTEAQLQTGAVSAHDDDDPALVEHLNAIRDYLMREIELQIERDIAAVEKRVRTSMMEIAISARVEGLNFREAGMRHELRRRDEMKFYFKDRQGRKRPSQKHIRTTWRHSLLTLWLDAFVYETSQRNVTEAVVDNSNHGHKWHGVSLSYVNDLPEYREEIFHPNSDNLLVLVSK